MSYYKGAIEMERFVPKQRTALDGKMWWVVYDNKEHKYSTLLCFGKYKTKKECRAAIDYYTNSETYKNYIK
jgi:hypothetical protein